VVGAGGVQAPVGVGQAEAYQGVVEGVVVVGEGGQVRLVAGLDDIEVPGHDHAGTADAGQVLQDALLEGAAPLAAVGGHAVGGPVHRDHSDGSPGLDRRGLGGAVGGGWFGALPTATRGGGRARYPRTGYGFPPGGWHGGLGGKPCRLVRTVPASPVGTHWGQSPAWDRIEPHTQLHTTSSR